MNSPSATFPLVTIGIPTYNRSGLLKSAVDSALRQDYPNLEVLICDNASTDTTANLCAKWVETDRRIRYVRHESNLGAAMNFKSVLEFARGEYFMWLADDDWIEPGYIKNCIDFFQANQGFFIVSGRVMYYQDEAPVREGEEFRLLQEAPLERVVDFCANNIHNAVFYGIMRRAELVKIPFLQTIGNDFLITIAAVYSGKVMMIDGPRMCRRIGGISASRSSVLADVRMSSLWIHFPWILAYRINVSIFADILWKCPVYHNMPLRARTVLATKAFITLVRRSDLSPIAALIQGIRNKLLVRKRLERLIKLWHRQPNRKI